MVDLKQALESHELIVLRVIGEWWELDLTGAQKPACVETVARALSGLDMALESAYLGPEEAAAFEDLVQAGGRLPVGAFERRHGQVRLMGPGRLEREEPWLDPVSPAEALWYRGFLYRGFDQGEGDELVEYYYLPEELMAPFEQPISRAPAAGEPERLSPSEEPERFREAAIWAVDDLTALLAAAQVEALDGGYRLMPPSWLVDPSLARLSLLATLAAERKLLRRSGSTLRPRREIVAWLQRSRESQLRDLVDAWSGSAWNDLCHTPGLVCEGDGWENDPILARTALLDVLPRDSSWYSIADVVALIKANDPDFQRQDGNYNTWYIRDEHRGGYLAGFGSWDQVEGRLLHFLIEGPLFWLGMCDLAAETEQEPARFRLTQRALDWLDGREPPADEETAPIVVMDDATVMVPFNADRYRRFQVARVAEPQLVQAGLPFHYRLTPASLSTAREQGIDLKRIITFLQKADPRPLPASTRRALERWQERGTEARLEQWVILRAKEPAILEKLRSHPKTSPLLAETMGELAVAVRPGDWPELRAAAARLGLLLDTGAGLITD
jgi:hypothetical protein